MAIFHFRWKCIRRSQGASAVASAAYRAGERIRDERRGRTYNSTKKRFVAHSEILIPEGAPDHLADRSTLWNEVEAVERRRNSILAREIEFAIPIELNEREGIGLARDYVAREFVTRGMI